MGAAMFVGRGNSTGDVNAGKRYGGDSASTNNDVDNVIVALLMTWRVGVNIMSVIKN